MAQMIREMAAGSGDPNGYLRKVAGDLEKNPPADINGGHEAPLDDLAYLLYEAYQYEFHDFKNRKFAAPKIELRNQLLELSENVVKGKYDN